VSGFSARHRFEDGKGQDCREIGGYSDIFAFSKRFERIGFEDTVITLTLPSGLFVPFT
jgi:hypothetical protein